MLDGMYGTSVKSAASYVSKSNGWFRHPIKAQRKIKATDTTFLIRNSISPGNASKYFLGSRGLFISIKNIKVLLMLSSCSAVFLSPSRAPLQMFLSLLLYIIIHHSNVVSHTSGKVIQHCLRKGNTHFIQLQLKNKNKPGQINGLLIRRHTSASRRFTRTLHLQF